MNIRDFEYLLALYKHQHFGKAASECFVSQPTLSGQFKKLEKELGLSLLERSAKGVVFSEAGLAIVERAKRVLIEVEEIQETARVFKDPKGGVMRIGIIPTICSFLLPHIVKVLRKNYPQMRFSFFELKTSEIISSLELGQLEMGVLATPLRVPGLEEQALYHESFTLALSTQHPKAKKKKIIQKDLLGENLLLLEDGHCFRDQALSLCDKQLPGMSVEMKGTSLETIINMVAMSEGVTLVPELAAQYWSSRKDIKFIPVEDPIPQREVGLIFRQNSAKSKVFEEIKNTIKPVLESILIKTRKKKIVIPVSV